MFIMGSTKGAGRPARTALLGLVLLGLSASVDALTIEYCSSENTGSGFSPVYSIYQSNGACQQTCNSKYAFAILQDKDCWCSNYAPGVTTSVSSCNEKCPGYPSDLCGNKAEGLYGYIAMSKAPLGTQGGSSSQQSSTKVFKFPRLQRRYTYSTRSATHHLAYPSFTNPSTHYFTHFTSQASDVPLTSYPFQSTSTPASSPSEVSESTATQTQTVDQTITVRPTPKKTTVVSYVTPSSSAQPSSNPPPPSSSSSSSSSTPPPTTRQHHHTPSPVTSVRVVTVSGAATTQTVTTTPSAGAVAPNSDPNPPKIERKGVSPGAVAGIVIGTVAGLALVLAGAFFLWRRQKNADTENGVSPRQRRPRRNISVLSKTGLLSRNRPPSVSENNYDEPYGTNIATRSNSVRNSMFMGAGAFVDNAGVNPSSPLGSSHDASSSRRHSKPLVYDQRLNPSALFANQEANGSRVSIQDQQDYSRPLGVMNPDLRNSFDSR